MKESKIYCLDNLELLKTLPENSVDLIYSDILFGTGKNFGDFVDLLPEKKIVDEHYTERIYQMHRVLSASGTLYLHMDCKISHWIRLILDDVFGYKNFRNEIIWHYNSAPRKKLDFGQRHDILLRYSKTDSYKFNPIREPYSLSAPRGYEKEKYYHPEGKVIGDVWNINILGQNDKTERVGYATQKPLALIERIVESSTDIGDLVADFYMGSGTTCVAAKKLGRYYIGCDSNPSACRIAETRLSKIENSL
ncbi:MAG TPA: site-specific DNA-methyltransferase [Leptospiraceae bacterium]|nr:site-specific DNA-methyltransferase [Leptospiraceae bacterium]